VGEFGLGPGACVDGDVEEHVAAATAVGAAVREVFERHDGELGDDGEADDASRAFAARTEVLELLVVLEKVGGGEEAAGGERIAV
jgi:hypothetical protein